MGALLEIFDLDETYVIKWAKETGYAIIIAAAAVGGTLLFDLRDILQADPDALDTLSEWQTWTVAAIAAVARVVWATFTNALRNPGE